MEDGSRPVLPINNGGSQEEVGIDDEDWEYVQEEQAEAVALVHSHTAGYGVTSPSSSTSTSINTTRARDVEEGAATLAQEEDDGTGSGRRKAIKLLKDLTTVPGKVEDVIVYKLQKLQRKPRVVYLKTYYKLLVLVGIFYALPSAQFVFFQYKHNASGLECYYNFKCAHYFLGFEAFNNIFSNIGYVVGGALFGLFIYIARKRNKTEVHGLHKDRSLYYCIALAMVWEGLFSSLYHICPSKVNYQFDTTFMVIGTGLMFITVFQKRHPTTAPGAVRAFIFFALLILISFLALTDIYVEIVWTFTFTVLIIAGLLGDIHFYYHKRLPVRTVIYNITHPWPPTEPGRLIGILFVNALSLGTLVYAAVDSITTNKAESVPNYMLAIVMINTFLYMTFYALMKMLHRERVHLFVWLLVVVSISTWGTALYFFQLGVTDKFLTPAESKLLNKPCVLFNFFDYHDIWHFLSAVGLASVAMLCYVLDFGLDARHKELPLF